MQLELPLPLSRPNSRAEAQSLAVAGQPLRLDFVRHRRARRYVLRLAPDGSIRVTVPWRGSIAEGRRFAIRNLAWLEKQVALRAISRAKPTGWSAGAVLLFRGEETVLKAGFEAGRQVVRWGTECCAVENLRTDFRPPVEAHLWDLAKRELPARTLELAAQHGLKIGRVSIRNQRSRWGSCSARGVISLNWRLVQTPPSVSDYIILHELAHLKVPNHSRRFWKEVERLCPQFAEAERWIRKNARRVF